MNKLLARQRMVSASEFPKKPSVDSLHPHAENRFAYPTHPSDCEELFKMTHDPFFRGCEAETLAAPKTAVPAVSKSIEWFHEGETRVVEVEGLHVTIRLVGRRGRRARIAIEAPAGAAFFALSRQ